MRSGFHVETEGKGEGGGEGGVGTGKGTGKPVHERLSKLPLANCPSVSPQCQREPKGCLN